MIEVGWCLELRVHLDAAGPPFCGLPVRVVEVLDARFRGETCGRTVRCGFTLEFQGGRADGGSATSLPTVRLSSAWAGSHRPSRYLPPR